MNPKPQNRKVENLNEAIRLHTALGFDKPTELAGLITVGTCCDVVGYRCEDLSKKTKANILTAYPRLKLGSFKSLAMVSIVVHLLV